jgi:hypothetical protein
MKRRAPSIIKEKVSKKNKEYPKKIRHTRRYYDKKATNEKEQISKIKIF